MRWNAIDDELLTYVSGLARLRASFPFVGASRFVPLSFAGRAISWVCLDANEALYMVVNGGDSPATVEMPVLVPGDAQTLKPVWGDAPAEALRSPAPLPFVPKNGTGPNCMTHLRVTVAPGQGAAFHHRFGQEVSL